MVQPVAEVDPIERYLSAEERATQNGVDTEPASLATADRSGHPSLSVVLLRQVDSRGFVFFNNYGSRKAREVTENPRAARFLAMGKPMDPRPMNPTVVIAKPRLNGTATF